MDDSDFVALFPLEVFLFIKSRSILRKSACSSKPHWQTRSSKLSLKSPTVFSILKDLLTLVLVDDQIRRCGTSWRSTNPLSLSSKSIRSGEPPALKPSAPWSIREPPNRRSCTNLRNLKQHLMICKCYLQSKMASEKNSNNGKYEINAVS